MKPLIKTVGWEIELSGKYKDSAVARQIKLYNELLECFPNDRQFVRSIHECLALLRHDPDNLDAFDYHYRMALNVVPEWGDGYLNWAAAFESSCSSKERRHAIEILEQGVLQASFQEGEDMRIRILERLIHRCAKERKDEDVQKYTDYLHKLRPIVPVSPSLRIRRVAPCPCGSGKKYRDCCGARK